jgi:hypothetical protein
MSDNIPSNSDLNDLRDTIAAATYLGLDVPAIAGTTAVEVTVRGLDWDDPDTSLGIYQTKEAAVIAVRNYVVERHDEMQEFAPWAEDVSDEDRVDAISFDTALNKARTVWLTKTDDEVIASMLGPDDFYYTQHRIEPSPTRTT